MKTFPFLFGTCVILGERKIFEHTSYYIVYDTSFRVLSDNLYKVSEYNKYVKMVELEEDNLIELYRAIYKYSEDEFEFTQNLQKFNLL